MMNTALKIENGFKVASENWLRVTRHLNGFKHETKIEKKQIIKRMSKKYKTKNDYHKVKVK